MEHYKKFLIRLQSFNIQIIKVSKGNQPVSSQQDAYELKHENPSIYLPFKSELKTLTELAITDILNLSPEQITLQLKRLDASKVMFRKFWKQYYSGEVPLSKEERVSFFFNLNLDEYFIVAGLAHNDYSILVPQEFIDDLYDSVLYREEYLKEFENRIYQILNGGGNTGTIPPPVIVQPEKTPTIKEQSVTDLFDILKDHFLPEQQEGLLQLLQSGKADGVQYIFTGNGNQLADAFKQLYEANLIVGCNKADLENWIQANFLYTDKGSQKKFTEKYLNNIISTDTKACQSPILDTKKNSEGQYVILPVQRIKRNRKSY